jgi:hypothetical protein
MKVRYETDIKENEEELKKMFLGEKRGNMKERIQALYLLKKGDCKDIKDLIGKIPRDRKTVSGRIKKYKTGGIILLLKIKSPPGRKSVLSDDIMMKLKEKLSDPNGYGSYNEIHKQVENEARKKINKKTLYHICHYRLKAVSKVQRPYNPKQNKENIRIFKENFSDDMKKRKLKRKNTGK